MLPRSLLHRFRLDPIFVGLLLVLVMSGPRSHAQTATAPFSIAKRVSNPAAAMTRGFQTIALMAQRRDEKSQVLNLTNSSFTEDLIIHEATLHGAWKVLGDMRLELDTAYQTGEKTKKNNIATASYNSDTTLKDGVDLVPVQFVLAQKLTPSIDIGLKGLYTGADVKTKNNYRTVVNSTTTLVDDQSTLKASFLVVGIGLTYEVFQNVYLGYTADFNEFKTQQIFNGSSTADGTSSPTTTSTLNFNTSRTKTVRRDTLGIATLLGDPKKSAFRLELSGERISPLTDRAGLNEGRLYQGTIEAQWLYFHLGVVYGISEGYLVDPNNLIPYFLKFEEFSNRSRTNLEFITGLRTSKGHSLSASYSYSKENIREQISSSDSQTYPTELATQIIGVSYSYVF